MSALNPNDTLELASSTNPASVLSPISSDSQAPIDKPTDIEAESALSEMGGYELATQLIAKLCHDFISPTGAIVSGMDLLDDPQAQDMREDALNLIRTSSKKMVHLVQFARIAYGAATSAESFSGQALKDLLAETFSTVRANPEFHIDDEAIFTKPAARALVNLGYISAQALPTGGQATINAKITDSHYLITSTSIGNRARLKEEAIEGLSGKPLGNGLHGQWIQPFWLYSIVKEAKGQLAFNCETDKVELAIRLPRSHQA